jgi:hypothetical protein
MHEILCRRKHAEDKNKHKRVAYQGDGQRLRQMRILCFSAMLLKWRREYNTQSRKQMSTLLAAGREEPTSVVVDIVISNKISNSSLSQ